MSNRTKISKPTQTLTAQGFVPVAGRKVGGCSQLWTHADGRKVRIDYGLYSATGQSSMGAGAAWGFFLSEAA